MVAVDDNWVCPYCGHAQVISSKRLDEDRHELNVEDWTYGHALLQWTAIVCANRSCRSLQLKIAVDGFKWKANKREATGYSSEWKLLPASSARPQPDYIPAALRIDYAEACAIRDLSPKASATITRRCLQGMIRDFCKIDKYKLSSAINELKRLVEAGEAPRGVSVEAVAAIEHVRSIGNIGAHMEEDINVIISVDKDEAQELIQLVELLFDEWYVARRKREEGLARIGAIAAEKAASQRDAKVTGDN